ncbi:hypothetical protein EYF80_025653 [Liparis tanakae]|uniref:Uncharacterized protein n=1 Tax=Liparis tanakae TaxID=230148 RepID=A0A4Z2HFU5_9TELE|nr:hypothetical protein EYF80_025653 [Liparis tanakae]
MDTMDSEFFFDSVLSSCQVVQGNGGCKSSICGERGIKQVMVRNLRPQRGVCAQVVEAELEQLQAAGQRPALQSLEGDARSKAAQASRRSLSAPSWPPPRPYSSNRLRARPRSPEVSAAWKASAATAWATSSRGPDSRSPTTGFPQTAAPSLAEPSSPSLRLPSKGSAIAPRHASVASKGERDLRKDSADGVRRKELEEAVSSPESSDSELGSDRGFAIPRVEARSPACRWSRTDRLATPNAPSSFSARSESPSSAGPELHTVRDSQHRWTITCWTLSRRPSCCSRDSTLGTGPDRKELTVEPALRRVQQLPGRLPQLTVAAGQVEGGHGGRAELLQQRVEEAGGVGGVGGAAAQPVAVLQRGHRVSGGAEETVRYV